MDGVTNHHARVNKNIVHTDSVPLSKAYVRLQARYRSLLRQHNQERRKKGTKSGRCGYCQGPPKGLCLQLGFPIQSLAATLGWVTLLLQLIWATVMKV